METSVAHRHEVRRRERDAQLDDLLSTPEGRENYWEGLRQECLRDSLISLLASTLHLDGDVIECGVYRGGSLFKIAREIADASCNKKIFACDSFEGFPEDSIDDNDATLFRSVDKLGAKFKLAADVPDRISRFAEYFHVDITIARGYFSQTLSCIASQTFSFVHLDVDICSSYRECLETLYPRLAKGGVAVFDDYGSRKWPGATKAIDEYFADKPVNIVRSFERDIPAWYVRKPE